MSTPRSSSPLNPHTSSNTYSAQGQIHHPPSSSPPMTSPTPGFTSLQQHGQTATTQLPPFPSFSYSSGRGRKSGHGFGNTLFDQRRSSPSGLGSGSGSGSGSTPASMSKSPPAMTQPRYSAQRSKRYSLPAASSSSSSSAHTHPADLFSEASTPTESLLWRERFSRRAEERERRKKARDADLDRRRGIASSSGNHGEGRTGNGTSSTPEEEEEADRRAQADDEEIFRRLVILQRNKARRAALVSHEQEVGDNDYLDVEPFWEEEETRELLRHLESTTASTDRASQTAQPGNHDGLRGSKLTLSRRNGGTQWTELRGSGSGNEQADEMEQWEREAAEAERAERAAEVEEAALAEQIEWAYQLSQQHQQQSVHHSDDAHAQAHGSSEARLDAADMDVNMDMDLDWGAMDAMDIE
ncbi:hypothetical protein I317_00355 [Kwoniella heveanensis CBS 569]|nr:hypothetical protein I317_00355 [Kwoniella heveanensis CBS 569]